jgi:hypothetical protein
MFTVVPIAFVLTLGTLAATQERPTAVEDLLTRLALETAAARDVPPIEVAIDGRKQFAVYDRFRLTVLAAREAIRQGRPLDAAALPPDLRSARVVILAFPSVPLSGDSQPPQSIQLNGRSGRRHTLEQARRLLPGVAIPELTVIASFEVPGLRPSDRISIVFNDSREMRSGIPTAGMVPGTFSSSVRMTAPESIATPAPVVPAGITLAKPRVDMRVEGILDLTGQVRYARALDGPAELHQAAAAAVVNWRYKPAMMFGVPIPLVMQATVSFER